QQIQKFQRNRRRGESADREDYDFYDITAWSLPFTFNLDAYWTEDATPLAGDVVTDTGPSPAPTPPATPPRAGSAYLFSNASDAGVSSDDVVRLHAPRIVVAAGDGVDQESYGTVWQFLANDLGVGFAPIPLANLASVADLADYNVLIIPDGNASRLKRQLGDDGVTRLKSWVSDGGVVIGFEGAGMLLADKDVG